MSFPVYSTTNSFLSKCRVENTPLPLLSKILTCGFICKVWKIYRFISQIGYIGKCKQHKQARYKTDVNFDICVYGRFGSRGCWKLSHLLCNKNGNFIFRKAMIRIVVRDDKRSVSEVFCTYGPGMDPAGKFGGGGC